MAAQARALFKADADLSDYYNHALAGGKWDHMMDQTHIGYTDWQQPPSNAMPRVVELKIPDGAEMGVAIEGSPLSLARRSRGTGVAGVRCVQSAAPVY